MARRSPVLLANPRRRAAALAAAAVLLLAGYYLAVLAPLSARQQRLWKEARELELQLQVATRARAQLDAARQAREQAAARFQELAGRIPRPDDLPRVMGFVQELATSRGLEVLQVRHSLQGTTAQPTGGRIDLEAQGTYGGVLALARALEARFPALRFGGVTVEEPPAQSQPEQASPQPSQTSQPSSQQPPRQPPQAAPGRPARPGSDRVRATVSFTVPVRPGTPGQPGRAEEVAWRSPPVTVASVPRDNPFRPALRLASSQRRQPQPARLEPAAWVTGVVLSSRGSFAVLRWGDRSHLVRRGDEVGPMRIVHVDSAGVVALVGGRLMRIPLGQSPAQT